MRSTRKNNSRLIFLLFFLGLGLVAQGQVVDEDEQSRSGKKKVSDELIRDIEQLLETVTEQTDETFDFNTFMEKLIDLAENPLNLNRAGYDELMDLRLLSAEQVDAIIRHREEFGKFISIYELQAVKGLDLATIEQILPFVTVKGNLEDYQVNSVKELLFDGDYQIFSRYTQVIEKKKGYTDLEEGETATRYYGNPTKFYMRFRYNFAQKLSYGFTIEKDPGEQVFGESQPRGFDYYSGHLFLRDVSIFKSIAIGDYEVKLGQGLIMWSGFGFGKSSMVTNIKKESDQLSPYTSVDENRFLRGVATTIRAHKNIEVTAFFSRDRKDATIATRDTIFETNIIAEVSSLQESGLHRTPSELENKDAVKLTTMGVHVKYQKRVSHIGITATHSRLSADLNRTRRLYNQFEFSGNHVTNWGMDYSWLWRNFYFFGEFAMSDSKGIATVNGFIASLDPKVDLAVTHRYYQRNYHSLFGNAFGESRNPYNEQGIYAGITVKPVRQIRLDTYIDYYKFPWLRYNVDAPSHGLDFLAQLTWRPSKKIEMYGRYKNEIKQGNRPDNDTKIDVLEDIGKQNIRFHITYKISRAFTFKNRFEYVIFDAVEKEQGYMVYQDVIYQPLSSPISFAARFALFDTKSYDSRIYAYENDVLYSFSIPPYYEKGTRFYIMLRYKITHGIDIWLRYAQTWFANRETVGSGLEEIQGSTRSEVKAQVRFRF